ncbi:glucose-induced degradation complex subunit GID7 [Sugiyamaella lignohabitans]|uniref:Glucose-induced degradation complex subunit GID7 n=1 Tax=Sugiyamaella lignohabitans TaxID=796027 RepID=A0A167EEN5_9ASCO|nr:glucose-induced degradation complex subunit GID7 [Sugiyamaella lignohabitans]ANB13981.1 glucose-induced degradation complex subunit GID7 [Sugiyamaella lignohabitans]
MTAIPMNRTRDSNNSSSTSNNSNGNSASSTSNGNSKLASTTGIEANGNGNNQNGNSTIASSASITSTESTAATLSERDSSAKNTSGIGTEVLSPTYFGFDKKETTRLLIQSLHDLGYHDIGKSLENASGYTIESPQVVDLRNAVLSGEWDNAEQILLAGSIEVPNPSDINSMIFLIRKQRYLEILEKDDREEALWFLRNQLSPVNGNGHKEELHFLSKLAMFSLDDIKADAHWDGVNGKSRQLLLESLQEHLSPSIMIPPHRLATLLHQAKSSQLKASDYYLGDESSATSDFSLYKDYVGDRTKFPNVTTHILKDHFDEVWYLAFSNDGKYLASSSADKRVFIWDVEDNFKLHRRLEGHHKGVVFFSWSPNDKYIVSCGQDSHAIVWDVQKGEKVSQASHDEAVDSCAWSHDNRSFITGSPDKKMILWDLDGREIHTWTNIRAQSMAVTPDGNRLIVICSDMIIHVFDLRTYEMITQISVSNKILTSISVSRDSRYAVISVAPEEIHLWDLETYRLVRKYVGQLQDEFVIRSSFGGLNENFILSGSEDSHVYIWNRDNANLIEALPGHTGTVNCVQWRPGHPAMFASAGDDSTIRIWQPASRQDL